MPKKEDEPQEWDPSQPLEDEDAETEANARAQGHARYEYLKSQHLAKLQKDGKDGKDKKKVKVFD